MAAITKMAAFTKNAIDKATMVSTLLKRIARRIDLFIRLQLSRVD